MMGNETSDLTDLNSIDSDDTGSACSNRPTSPSIFGTHEERNVNPDNNQPSPKNIETTEEGSCSALKERLTETAQREPKDNGFVTTEPDENSNTNKFVAVIAELKGKQLSVKSPPPVHPKPNPTICTVDRKCSGQILQTQTRLCTNSENVVNTSFLLEDENNTDCKKISDSSCTEESLRPTSNDLRKIRELRSVTSIRAKFEQSSSEHGVRRKSNPPKVAPKPPTLKRGKTWGENRSSSGSNEVTLTSTTTFADKNPERNESTEENEAITVQENQSHMSLKEAQTLPNQLDQNQMKNEDKDTVLQYEQQQNKKSLSQESQLKEQNPNKEINARPLKENNEVKVSQGEDLLESTKDRQQSSTQIQRTEECTRNRLIFVPVYRGGPSYESSRNLPKDSHQINERTALDQENLSFSSQINKLGSENGMNEVHDLEESATNKLRTGLTEANPVEQSYEEVIDELPLEKKNSVIINEVLDHKIDCRHGMHENTIQNQSTEILRSEVKEETKDSNNQILCLQAESEELSNQRNKSKESKSRMQIPLSNAQELNGVDQIKHLDLKTDITINQPVDENRTPKIDLEESATNKLRTGLTEANLVEQSYEEGIDELPLEKKNSVIINEVLDHKLDCRHGMHENTIQNQSTEILRSEVNEETKDSDNQILCLQAGNEELSNQRNKSKESKSRMRIPLSNAKDDDQIKHLDLKTDITINQPVDENRTHIENLRQENERLKHQVGQHEEANRHFRSQFEELELKHDLLILSYVSQVRHAHEFIDHMVDQSEDAGQKENTRIQELEQENKMLAAQNFRLESSVADKYNQLQDLKEGNEDLLSLVRQQETQIQTLEERLEDQNNALKEACSIKNNRIDELQQDRQLLQEASEEANKIIQELEQKRIALLYQINRLEEINEQKDDQIQHCQKQLEGLTNQVNQLTEANERMNGRIRQLELEAHWIIDRNEIKITGQILGKGGWGEVQIGTFRGTTVAVKTMYEIILSDQNRRLFNREMSIASTCRHPCLLQFIGATNDNGNPLFVTEVLETTLRKLLESDVLEKEQIICIAHDISCGLNYLHKMKPSPIVHRDISSSNVLLWHDRHLWRAKLSDYGSANFLAQCTTNCPGAQLYSAPEAVSGRQETKTDIYSFGVVFYEMWTRQLPDPRDRDEDIKKVPVQEYRNLITRCLQKIPGQRPSAEDLVNFFELQKVKLKRTAEKIRK